MKLLRNIFNMLAVVMVLLSGALPLHASEPLMQTTSMEQLDHDHALVPAESHSHNLADQIVHCGAPILGAEPFRLSCSLPTSSVVYFEHDGSSPFAVTDENLRPPRA
ncbi:hypothetical protein [Devosia marina]|uniref:hypothetical protein n=1 Tax=Devosia marina TaxID=2683198 RepID=UPI0012F849BB|nr:hypothetical protein [Devosia marina]